MAICHSSVLHFTDTKNDNPQFAYQLPRWTYGDCGGDYSRINAETKDKGVSQLGEGITTTDSTIPTTVTKLRINSPRIQFDGVWLPLLPL